MSANFELSMYEDKACLPIGKQLFDVFDLVGHTIKAVFEPTHPKRFAELVLLTETDCFIAMSAETAGYCSEDGAGIAIHGESWSHQTLMSYVPADDLLLSGVITKAAFDVLDRAQKEKDAAARETRAKALRAELAQLEGGAE